MVKSTYLRKKSKNKSKKRKSYRRKSSQRKSSQRKKYFKKRKMKGGAVMAPKPGKRYKIKEVETDKATGIQRKFDEKKDPYLDFKGIYSIDHEGFLYPLTEHILKEAALKCCRERGGVWAWRNFAAGFSQLKPGSWTSETERRVYDEQLQIPEPAVVREGVVVDLDTSRPSSAPSSPVQDTAAASRKQLPATSPGGGDVIIPKLGRRYEIEEVEEGQEEEKPDFKGIYSIDHMGFLHPLTEDYLTEAGLKCCKNLGGYWRNYAGQTPPFPVSARWA